MSDKADEGMGNFKGDNRGTATLTAEVEGATLNSDKSSENAGTAKDSGKPYIGSLPDNKGMGATGVRDITSSEEVDARAAQLGGDPDVADSKP